MAIDFSRCRWDKIERDYTAWWEGMLERPLINIELTGAEPGMPKPIEPMFEAAGYYDFSISANTIVRHWEYMLSCKRYVGDAYPNILPDFGPGVNAAFLGARGRVTPQTIWFEAEKKIPMEELHLRFEPAEPWFNRIKDIYRAASEYFKGSICLGMTHLNNGIDPVAPFISAEALALAFYDDPNNLKRLIWENHELCIKYYNEFTDVIGATNPGYTCWGYMFSKKPWFMWQSDFSVMLGPAMFEEFLLPELSACCRKFENSFYHLDGTGELQHLDMILSIPELKGVQWIPEAGKPDYKHWPEVYRKIRKAGKLIQLFGELDTLEVVADQLGSAKGIYYYNTVDISEEDKVMKLLEKFNAV